VKVVDILMISHHKDDETGKDIKVLSILVGDQV
jgi:hypothetical protein